jgi:hypothetical protein
MAMATREECRLLGRIRTMGAGRVVGRQSAAQQPRVSHPSHAVADLRRDGEFLELARRRSFSRIVRRARAPRLRRRRITKLAAFKTLLTARAQRVLQISADRILQAARTKGNVRSRIPTS